MPRPVMPRLLLVVAAAAVIGCGGDPTAEGEGEGGAPPDGATMREPRPSEAGRSCDDISVPGHLATGVRTRGPSCEQVARIVRGAVGQGRAAYRTAGFLCAPTPADDGDTDYACTGGGGARVTFRYGAAA